MADQQPPKTPLKKTSKKKKLVIKKKLPQRKDISEHFGAANVAAKKMVRSSAPDPQARPKRKPKRFIPSPSTQGFKPNSSPPLAVEVSGESSRTNLLMQAAPPTAAQARDKTVRSSHGARAEYRHDKEKQPEEQLISPKKKQQATSINVVPRKIDIMESIQVGELAKKLNLRPNEVIGRLMRMGEMVTINKTIDSETATLLAAEYNCEANVVSLYDETIVKEEEVKIENLCSRPPVVTIMGHVDHGKTQLLDTIRRSNVIDNEAGAITQHIGAYQVVTQRGKITFLDTPGHEAFSAMRARGAAVTDIVILVVAADDGVKQQTQEAIAHARDAKVPILVAINKIDLPDIDTEKVKKELSQHGLSPEAWGGDTVFCEVSAKENQGIDQLLEMILLQADLLNLQADPNLRAKGHVIEAKIDPGKGPVATVLVQAGVLREGDPYVVGIYSGRIRAMHNDQGVRIKEALPATPVEITGIDKVPAAGDPFQVVESEKYGREIALKRQHYQHITTSAQRSKLASGTNLWGEQGHKEFYVIIKADVQGSVEAIKDGLLRLSTDDVKVQVVHGATGAISESDVNLASASCAMIIGFQVRATPRVTELAEYNNVKIKYYSIIYDLIQNVRQIMEGMLEPDQIEEIVAKVDIRQVFKISRLGSVAGCMILSGSIRRNHPVRVIRDGVVIHTGNIRSLRRVKDDVTEVAEGYECGIALESFNDMREGDQLESFQIKEVARKL